MLHVGVVLAAIYGLPALVDPVDMVEQPIIVELVTIAERTVSQERAKSEPEKAPPPAPKLKPVAAPKAEPEPEPKPAPMKTPPPPPPEPVKVTAPPPPPPEPPKAEPKRSPKAIENAKVIAPPPPEPKKIPEKPKEKPKPPKKVAAAEPAKIFRGLPRPRAKPKRWRPKFSTDRIAALLDKDQEKKPQPRQERSKRQATAKARKAFKDISIPPAPARVRSVPMTMSEIDAIRYQIQQCWSIPAGARDAENLVVRIKVFLNSDGSLSKPPEIVGGGSGGGASDPFFRTAAESARRAVLKCSPLKNLPPDKYARWREITLTFNPRDMLGG
jgi:hypothetical protein